MTTFKKTLSTKEKEIYLKALIYILSKEERKCADNDEYLRQQAEQAGFDPAAVKKIKPAKKADDLIKELKQVSSMRLKRYIIREMIMLAMANHELSDEEMAAIYTIGMNIGIKEDKINDFFLWAAEGLEWQLAGVKLVEEDL